MAEQPTGRDHYTLISSDTPRRRKSRPVPRVSWTPGFMRTSTPGAAATRNPFKDLGDKPPAPQLGRRDAQTRSRTATASSARVIFPNTVPPFFPELRPVSRAPPEARRVLPPPGRHPRSTTAGSRTFCSRFPRGAAPASGRFFLNDIDGRDRGRDMDPGAQTFAAGSCCPRSRPDVDWIKTPSTIRTMTGSGPSARISTLPVNCHGGNRGRRPTRRCRHRR